MGGSPLCDQCPISHSPTSLSRTCPSLLMARMLNPSHLPSPPNSPPLRPSSCVTTSLQSFLMPLDIACSLLLHGKSLLYGRVMGPFTHLALNSGFLGTYLISSRLQALEAGAVCGPFHQGGALQSGVKSHGFKSQLCHH